jgi:hypothetical protein
VGGSQLEKGKIREEYRGLSRDELLDKAYELGFNYEKYSFSCSQSVVAALYRLIEIDDVLVKVSMPLSGGTAEQFMGTCGSLSGGLMVLSYFIGRPVEKMSDTERNIGVSKPLFASLRTTKLLVDKYVEQYGTILCPHIQRKIFGRTWWLRDVEEMQKFESLGGHSAPDKCAHIAGTGARWVLEILLDKGMLDFPAAA